MVLKFKKNANIDIYSCNIYDVLSDSINNRIVRVKEGYNPGKLFTDCTDIEVLCKYEKIDTEKHEMICGLNLDTMEITVLKDNIVNK